MYSVRRIRRALANPVRIGLECNRLYHRRGRLRAYNPTGIDVFDEEWDTLVILDACRYDLFARRSTLPGTLEKRRSRGSSTVEFLRGNVAGRDLRDTVYVTANPQLYRHRDELDARFHDVIHVWMDEGWDDEHETVLPETTTEHARRAAANYPNKRLLIHYLQPHYPFIDAGTSFDKGHVNGRSDEDVFWLRLTAGRLDIDASEIWRAYTRNLDRVLPSVESLIDDLDGRTVVTSDHGNMIDERAFPLPFRLWGHPEGIHLDPLITVPWLVNEGRRREIVAGSAANDDRAVADGVVTERLEALGYR